MSLINSHVLSEPANEVSPVDLTGGKITWLELDYDFFDVSQALSQLLGYSSQSDFERATHRCVDLSFAGERT